DLHSFPTRRSSDLNGTNTEKSVKTPESAISLKRRWKDDNIERGTIGDQIDCDNSQQELIMETSEVSDKGERIKEIDFIECVRSGDWDGYIEACVRIWC